MGVGCRPADNDPSIWGQIRLSVPAQHLLCFTFLMTREKNLPPIPSPLLASAPAATPVVSGVTLDAGKEWIDSLEWLKRVRCSVIRGGRRGGGSGSK